MTTHCHCQSGMCVAGTNAGSQSDGRDADPSRPNPKTLEGEERCDRRNDHRRRRRTGGAENGLAVLRPVPRVSTAVPATQSSCDTQVSRSTHPPAHRRPPGTRPRRLPRARAPPNGTSSCGMSQPLRVAGVAGTQQHRDRPGIVKPGASRRTPRGLGRESPNTCWVQPPVGLTPWRDRHEQIVTRTVPTPL